MKVTSWNLPPLLLLLSNWVLFWCDLHDTVGWFGLSKLHWFEFVWPFVWNEGRTNLIIKTTVNDGDSSVVWVVFSSKNLGNPTDPEGFHICRLACGKTLNCRKHKCEVGDSQVDFVLKQWFFWGFFNLCFCVFMPVTLKFLLFLITLVILSQRKMWKLFECKFHRIILCLW